MKDVLVIIAAIIGFVPPLKCDATLDTFIGPGIVECTQGECEFSVKLGTGCFDPCHTKSHYHMYDTAFNDIANVMSIDKASNGIDGEHCFYTHANHINARYPDQYIDIEEGCTAKCHDCVFAPTIILSGPIKIDCRDGRCTNYTTEHFDCGRAVEEASESFGSFQTLLDGSNTVHSLYGYEGINTAEPITIPQTCTLSCSGCRRHIDAHARKKKVRGIKKRWTNSSN